MGIKTKFILNVAVILLIFAAFHPSTQVAEDYGVSLVILAVAATIFEDHLAFLRRAKKNPSPADSRMRRVGVWGTALSLAAAVVAAIVVPVIHRNAAQEQAQQEQTHVQEQREMTKMFSDPKVQEGMRVLQDLEARRQAQLSSTTQSTPATTQSTIWPVTAPSSAHEP